jgi:hypothetical protein
MASLLMIWAVGCSNNPTDTTGDTTNLAEDFGGYTATDEAPGFGDPDLIATEGEEVEIDDPMLSSAPIQELLNDMDAGMFHFRAVWGRIPYDSTVTEVTDWTGSLTVSRGALVIRRLIRFELNQDTYLPRTERELVEWVSATTVHNDGIAVDVFVPPPELVIDTSFVVDGTDTTWTYDTLPVDPVTLTFETGPYTRTFTLEELAALDEVVELADGNKVAFHGIQFFRQVVCPRGILAGHWGYDDEGNGVFEGLWFSHRGYVDGYVHGHFGVNEQGEKVFYGKWVDRDGLFEGLLRGIYGYAPWVRNSDVASHRPSGWFRGRIFDASENPIGALAGRYGAAPNVHGGWFQARWKLYCNEITINDNGRGERYRFGALDDGLDF